MASTSRSVLTSYLVLLIAGTMFIITSIILVSLGYSYGWWFDIIGLTMLLGAIVLRRKHNTRLQMEAMRQQQANVPVTYQVQQIPGQQVILSPQYPPTNQYVYTTTATPGVVPVNVQNPPPAIIQYGSGDVPYPNPPPYTSSVGFNPSTYPTPVSTNLESQPPYPASNPFTMQGRPKQPPYPSEETSKDSSSSDSSSNGDSVNQSPPPYNEVNKY